MLLERYEEAADMYRSLHKYIVKKYGRDSLKVAEVQRVLSECLEQCGRIDDAIDALIVVGYFALCGKKPSHITFRH